MSIFCDFSDFLDSLTNCENIETNYDNIDTNYDNFEIDYDYFDINYDNLDLSADKAEIDCDNIDQAVLFFESNRTHIGLLHFNLPLYLVIKNGPGLLIPYNIDRLQV